MSSHNEFDDNLKVDLKINDNDTCDITLKNVSLHYKDQLVSLLKKEPKNISLDDLEDLIFQAKVRSEIKNKNLVEPIVSEENINKNLVEKKTTFKPDFLNQIDLSNNIVEDDIFQSKITLISPKDIDSKNKFLFPIKTRRLTPIYDCKEQQKKDMEIYVNSDNTDEHNKYIKDLQVYFSKSRSNDDLESLDFHDKVKDDSISVSKNDNLIIYETAEDEFACFSDFETGLNENYGFDSFEDESEIEIDYPEKDYSDYSEDEFDCDLDYRYRYNNYISDEESIEENIIVESDIQIENISDDDNVNYAHPERIVNNLETFDIMEECNTEKKSEKESHNINEIDPQEILIEFDPLKTVSYDCNKENDYNLSNKLYKDTEIEVDIMDANNITTVDNIVSDKTISPIKFKGVGETMNVWNEEDEINIESENVNEENDEEKDNVSEESDNENEKCDEVNDNVSEESDNENEKCDDENDNVNKECDEINIDKDNIELNFKGSGETMNVWNEKKDEDTDNAQNYVEKMKKEVLEDEKNNCVIC